MTYSVSFIFALLLIFGYQQTCKSESKSNIKKYMGYGVNVFKLGPDIFAGIEVITNKLLPKTTKESESDVKIDPGMEQRITDQIKHVSKKLGSLKVDIQNVKEEIIDRISIELPKQLSLRNILFEIYLRINQIETSYETFLTYIQEPTKYNNYTLKRFAKAVTSPELTELPNSLKTIHWLLVQKDLNDNVLTFLSTSSQTPTQMCEIQKSLQQMIYDLYNAIALADLKGSVMIQFGYRILQLIKGGDRTKEMNEAKRAFTNRITRTLEHVKNAMRPASRALWRCDSSMQEEGVTYTKLKNVFQKYIINEVDLNSMHTCTNTCTDYNKTKVFGCYNKKLCAQQRTCSGSLYDCEYKIAGTMYICPSDNNSNRRYEYIEYGNSQRFGPKGKCKYAATNISSWPRGFVQCSYCLCTCDDVEHTNSDRYINLRPSVSNILQNYVVTGVRFRKANNIMHIQVQEGLLLPDGRINETTVRWKSIEDYKINQVLPKSNKTNWEYYTVENVDYHVLEWKVKRELHRDDNFMYTKAAINLDDLDFAEQASGDHRNYVVCGLRFSVNTVYGSGYHLNLEVLMIPFNFITGKIDTNKSMWYAAYREFNGKERYVKKSAKTQVNLENLDIPINFGASTVPTSHTNQYLYFTTSSMDTDAGQNMIPFIDLKPVETNPPTPLSGAGLFHKSSAGSGGFLALKLFTYDYSSQL